jgi:antitoxin StbD
MNLAVRDRATNVLATSEARRSLHETLRNFCKHGVEAEPVFFGSHRRPTGVMLSYERYVELLDRLDDLAIALEVARRDEADDGTRFTTEEVFAEFGIDIEAIDAKLDAAEQAEAAEKHA